MFQVREIVVPSGKGRTGNWPEKPGTVTRVTNEAVFVQWHHCAVEDEMQADELISTGTFADKIPTVVAQIPIDEEPPTVH